MVAIAAISYLTLYSMQEILAAKNSEYSRNGNQYMYVIKNNKLYIVSTNKDNIREICIIDSEPHVLELDTFMENGVQYIGPLNLSCDEVILVNMRGDIVDSLNSINNNNYIRLRQENPFPPSLYLNIYTSSITKINSQPGRYNYLYLSRVYTNPRSQILEPNTTYALDIGKMKLTRISNRSFIEINDTKYGIEYPNETSFAVRDKLAEYIDTYGFVHISLVANTSPNNIVPLGIENVSDFLYRTYPRSTDIIILSKEYTLLNGTRFNTSSYIKLYILFNHKITYARLRGKNTGNTYLTNYTIIYNIKAVVGNRTYRVGYSTYVYGASIVNYNIPVNLSIPPIFVSANNSISIYLNITYIIDYVNYIPEPLELILAYNIEGLVAGHTIGIEPINTIHIVSDSNYTYPMYSGQVNLTCIGSYSGSRCIMEIGNYTKFVAPPRLVILTGTMTVNYSERISSDIMLDISKHPIDILYLNTSQWGILQSTVWLKTYGNPVNITYTVPGLVKIGNTIVNVNNDIYILIDKLNNISLIYNGTTLRQVNAANYILIQNTQVIEQIEFMMPQIWVNTPAPLLIEITYVDGLTVEYSINSSSKLVELKPIFVKEIMIKPTLEPTQILVSVPYRKLVVYSNGVLYMVSDANTLDTIYIFGFKLVLLEINGRRYTLILSPNPP